MTMTVKELIKALNHMPEHYTVHTSKLKDMENWLVCYNPDFKFPPEKRTELSQGINLNYSSTGGKNR